MSSCQTLRWWALFQRSFKIIFDNLNLLPPQVGVGRFRLSFELLFAISV